MVELIQYAAAIAVVATLVSESAILSPIRDRFGYSILYCPICLGFWFGLPVLMNGVLFYLAAVGMSHIFMLITLRVYAELDKLNGQ